LLTMGTAPERSRSGLPKTRPNFQASKYYLAIVDDHIIPEQLKQLPDIVDYSSIYKFLGKWKVHNYGLFR